MIPTFTSPTLLPTPRLRPRTLHPHKLRSSLPYFAYGSNLNPKILGPQAPKPSPRHLPPHKTTLATLPNHRLAFTTPGLPPFEPCFANIHKSREDDQVLGVLHWIDENQFERVARSEGVGWNFGGSVVKEVRVFSEDVWVVGRTFVWDVGGWMGELGLRKPSRRYLKLIVDGVRSSGLPEWYVEYVKNVANDG